MARIGVDFGGTQIKAGLVDEQVVIRSAVRNTRDAAGPSDVLDLVADAVRELTSSPESVGFAIPGEVDGKGRCWRLPNVPGFEGVAVADELSRRVGCRVVVENDATVAALAEMVYGHGRAYASFAMLTLGTGVGGGVVLNHQLWRGTHGFAGELGHLPIDRQQGWPCACGLLGCLESYAGTRGLLNSYRELGGGEAETILEIANATRTGSAAGRQTFEKMGWALAVGISGIQNVLDLDAFVFTGGVSSSFDLIEPALRATLKRVAFAPPLASVPLLVSELGTAAGQVGAALLPTL
jgi:glucokinase